MPEYILTMRSTLERTAHVTAPSAKYVLENWPELIPECGWEGSESINFKPTVRRVKHD